MPGRTPVEAVEAFLEPLRTAVACVSCAKITLSEDGRQLAGRVHALTLNRGLQPAQMKSAAHGRLLLDIRQQYEIVPVPEDKQIERGASWRVSTRGYMYSMRRDSGEIVFDYHWHPNSKNKAPHFHVGTAQLAKGGVVRKQDHFPCGRISVESLVRACITEWGVEPLKSTWEECLALSEATFVLYRTWSNHPRE